MNKKIKRDNRKGDKTKKSIYLRTFSALLGVYLVLMIGFSFVLISKEKKVELLEYNSFASFTHEGIVSLLQDHLGDQDQITDLHKLKKELTIKRSQFGFYDPGSKQAKFNDTEIALFSSDYNLIFNSDHSWICTYSINEEGSTKYNSVDAYINPQEWFSDEEIKEIETYLNAQPNVEKVGDLSGYTVSLWGFWVEDDQIIPEEIHVVPMYATSIDEGGNTSGGSHSNAIVYRSNYVDQKNLPFFKYGTVLRTTIGLLDKDKQAQLQTMVRDQEKLKKAVKVYDWSSYQRTGFFTYDHYLVSPYGLVHLSPDQDPYSRCWIVFGHEVNLWERCSETLVLVWGSCFITFVIVAFILSTQTYKTYKKREELERFRKETTNALAHDLKTPLSIISGYAQNLMENVHTEKREYYAKGIETNIKRMDKIILEMLELSRLESDALSIKDEELSLSKLSEEIIEQYKELCHEKSITTSLEGEAVIRADHALIKRAIENFVVNALDNTPDGGTIRVRITGDTFEFYNSGSHILEEKLKEIWEPYKKGEESRNKTKGTGLGLAISRRIFELYNYTYGANNREDGVVFWFKFTQ